MENNIAQTIAQQIGNKAFYMMGVKQIITSEDSISFRIKNSKNVNNIKITYDIGADLYNVEFGRIRGVKYTVVETHEGVYFDMLHSLIEATTGLYLSL